MKKKINLFIGMFLLVGVISAQEKQAEKSIIKTEVNSVLDDWHNAASEADFDRYFNIMDDVSIFVGTDAAEIWSKEEFKKFSKPYFDKGKAWSFSPLQRNIYVHLSNTMVWFDETLDTWMGVCRGSGVLEKVNDKWKIKHYVLSVAVPNEDIKPIIKIKQKRDSLFVKRFK